MLKICVICNEEFETSKTTPYQIYCSKKCNSKAHQPRKIERQRERLMEKRRKLFKILGGKCVACGQEDYYVLQFDHIHRDGYLEKSDETFLTKYLGNIELAEKTLQILCCNHNGLKQYHPHIWKKRFPNIK